MKIKKYFLLILIAFLVLSFGSAGLTVSAISAADASCLMQPLVDKLAGMTPEEIEANVIKYYDIRSHWGRTVIGKLTGLEIMSGYGNGRFMPDAPVQADQFLKMVVRALGYKVTESSPYWGTGYIYAAKELKLVREGEIKDFKKPLTRECMARIITRAAYLVEADSGDKYDQYIIGMVMDYQKIQDACKQSVINAFKLGLVTGSGGVFRPTGTLTRAEAAAVVVRLLDKTERKPMKPGEGEVLVVQTLEGSAEFYPGAVREFFFVTKALNDEIPKAKGFITTGVDIKTGMADSWMFTDEQSYKDSMYNAVAVFGVDPSSERYPYSLDIYILPGCNKLFTDYIHSVLKVLFKNESDKAILLYDKYALMKTNQRKYEDCVISNRQVAIIRQNANVLTLQVGKLNTKIKY